jgi:hypothetical protein
VIASLAVGNEEYVGPARVSHLAIWAGLTHPLNEADVMAESSFRSVQRSLSGFRLRTGATDGALMVGLMNGKRTFRCSYK